MEASAGVKAPRHLPMPHEQLVGAQPVAAGDERDGLNGQIHFFDEARLLLRGSVPTTLDGGDHLDALGVMAVDASRTFIDTTR